MGWGRSRQAAGKLWDEEKQYYPTVTVKVCGHGLLWQQRLRKSPPGQKSILGSVPRLEHHPRRSRWGWGKTHRWDTLGFSPPFLTA